MPLVSVGGKCPGQKLGFAALMLVYEFIPAGEKKLGPCWSVLCLRGVSRCQKIRTQSSRSFLPLPLPLPRQKPIFPLFFVVKVGWDRRCRGSWVRVQPKPTYSPYPSQLFQAGQQGRSRTETHTGQQNFLPPSKVTPEPDRATLHQPVIVYPSPASWQPDSMGREQ